MCYIKWLTENLFCRIRGWDFYCECRIRNAFVWRYWFVITLQLAGEENLMTDINNESELYQCQIYTERSSGSNRWSKTMEESAEWNEKWQRQESSGVTLRSTWYKNNLCQRKWWWIRRWKIFCQFCLKGEDLSYVQKKGLWKQPAWIQRQWKWRPQALHIWRYDSGAACLCLRHLHCFTLHICRLRDGNSVFMIWNIGERTLVGNYVEVFSREDCFHALKPPILYGASFCAACACAYFCITLSFKIKWVFKGFCFPISCMNCSRIYL